MSHTTRALKNPLGVHHLCALDVGAPELVDLAARAGLRHVSLFIRAIRPGDTMFPAIEDAGLLRQVKDRLAATGVSVHNIDIFPINPRTKLELYRDALERGAELGARRLTSTIADPETARAHDNFAGLCDMAAAYGIDVHIEFTAFSVVKSLADARTFLDGHRPANATIAIDALHLYRNDGGPGGLADCPADLIGYAQLNDGPLMAPATPEAVFHEAIYERGAPGSGEFDLDGLIDLLPGGILFDIEAPSKAAIDRGVDPLTRIKALVDSTRRIAGSRIEE